jgi:hypothetical protein
MTSFGKFTLRFAVYGVALLYLVGDLLIFHGPLYQRVQASRLDSPESIAAARARGVVATVYGREITRSQIDHLVITRLAQAGGPAIDVLPPEQLRLHRYAALNELIDHEILRVKAMHSSTELAIHDAQIDAAVARVANRFPNQETFLSAVEKSGTTPEAHRARIAARLQQIAFAESRIAELAPPSDARARHQAANDFRKTLRDFEANRDRIHIHHEMLK